MLIRLIFVMQLPTTIANKVYYINSIILSVQCTYNINPELHTAFRRVVKIYCKYFTVYTTMLTVTSSPMPIQCG